MLKVQYLEFNQLNAPPYSYPPPNHHTPPFSLPLVLPYPSFFLHLPILTPPFSYPFQFLTPPFLSLLFLTPFISLLPLFLLLLFLTPPFPYPYLFISPLPFLTPSFSYPHSLPLPFYLPLSFLTPVSPYPFYFFYPTISLFLYFLPLPFLSPPFFTPSFSYPFPYPFPASFLYLFLTPFFPLLSLVKHVLKRTMNAKSSISRFLKFGFSNKNRKCRWRSLEVCLLWATVRAQPGDSVDGITHHYV